MVTYIIFFPAKAKSTSQRDAKMYTPPDTFCLHQQEALRFQVNAFLFVLRGVYVSRIAACLPRQFDSVYRQARDPSQYLNNQLLEGGGVVESSPPRVVYTGIDILSRATAYRSLTCSAWLQNPPEASHDKLIHLNFAD